MTLRAEDAEPFTITPVPGEEADDEPGTPDQGAGCASPNCQEDRLTVDDGRPFAELADSGLLWLINRVVFHPRGLALTLHTADGAAVGWSLQGDGSEEWSFEPEADRRGFLAAQRTLAEAERPVKVDYRPYDKDERESVITINVNGAMPSGGDLANYINSTLMRMRNGPYRA